MIDPGDFFEGMVSAFMKVLTDWWNQLAGITSEGAAELTRPVIDWMRTSTNFVTSTPRNLVTALDGVLGITQVEPLLNAMAGLAILVAGASYIGHRMFGWPGLDESVSRIGMTIVLTGSSIRLMDISLDVFDGLTRGLAAQIPDVPGLDGLHPVVLVILLLIWTFLLGRLMLTAAERVAWMAILRPAILLGSMTWIHPSIAWIATMLWKMWAGFLISQILVILAMLTAAQLVSVGGFGGYVLSCACLNVARQAIYQFVPRGAGFTMPRIPIRR